jgi:hypothetical protein
MEIKIANAPHFRKVFARKIRAYWIKHVELRGYYRVSKGCYAPVKK